MKNFGQTKKNARSNRKFIESVNSCCQLSLVPEIRHKQAIDSSPRKFFAVKLVIFIFLSSSLSRLSYNLTTFCALNVCPEKFKQVKLFSSIVL